MILNITSYEIINYKCNYLKLFKNNNLISYNDIIKIKNDVNRIYVHKDNKYVLLLLNNKTIYNYKNTKYDDILGILPIISLFTK